MGIDKVGIDKVGIDKVGITPLNYGNVLLLLLSTQAVKLLADIVRAHLQSNFYKLSGGLCIALHCTPMQLQILNNC